jgi:NADH-quinone oxidoreductase subunit A
MNPPSSHYHIPNTHIVDIITSDYILFFMFLLVGFFISSLIFFLAYLVAPKQFDSEKISTYECGFQPFHNSRLPFDIHFYIIAILFLIFDVELVFIYPWITISFYNGISGFLTFLLFIVIIGIGFVYEWKKNILDWNKDLFYNDDIRY